MGVRRVVTGHDESGKSVFASDENVEPDRPSLLPSSEFYQLWGGDTTPEFLPKTPGDLMHPTASLAVLIYNFSSSPFDNQIELAWAAALVLVVLVLAVNLCGQALARRRA